MIKNILEKIIKTYSVGVPFLDIQHRRLASLISSLCRMCRKYEKIEKIYFAKRLKETLYYFNYHFSCEEEIMRETAYWNFEEHESDHSGFFLLFLDQVKLFESPASSEGTFASRDGTRSHFDPEEFARFLQEWLNSHLAMDTALGLYIKKSHEHSHYLSESEQKPVQAQFA
jgi:hemerythrin-like metal-binding protein